MIINRRSSLILLLVLILEFPSTSALVFNFPDFSSVQNLNRSGDASFLNNMVSLTRNQADVSSNGSVGRLVYSEELHLWDAGTGQVADFVTHFSFKISMLLPPYGGDGMAFFLAPNGSHTSEEAGGGCLGLIRNCSSLNATTMVAVEFDTYKNTYDQNGNHVAIDVNSIWSVASLNWTTDMKNESMGNAWIRYDSQRKNLSLFLSYDDDPVFTGQSSLSYTVDLAEVLPEWVTVGFSSATGSQTEVHYILSWKFNSTEFPVPPPTESPIPPPTDFVIPVTEVTEGGGLNVALVVGFSVGGVAILGAGFTAIFLCRRRRRRSRRDVKEDVAIDDTMDQEFEQGMGPRRFSYAELVQATSNFSEEGKLGQGGFGGVYRGYLPLPLNVPVAVKRISTGSKQGKKEYMAEVMIISRLRHKNLVQLVGWCHENNEFLLVYELMSNGSLDSHLFKRENLLSWPTRYKIARGLASALLYLHEEWEKSVVHRDIKTSNVMLDSNFNTKLGDFGLARLMDNEFGLKTTGLAGTFGYMAPEYISSGKASKWSDVYSFGIVALEIACGRKPIKPSNVESEISLVGWVWELYGNGKALDSADSRLKMGFDKGEMECLLMVGMWCAHPNYNLRPTIRQALQVLNFEAPLPNLPAEMPVPRFDAPTSSTTSSSSGTEPLLYSMSISALR